MLRFRPYKPCDAAAIVSWLGDAVSFRQWCADRYESYPITADDMNRHYQTFDGSDSFYPMTAFDETGIVGHLILRFTDEGKSVLRFGFVIVDSKKRGMGYGKQMLELAVKYAFEILKAEKITLCVFDNNKPAHKCYQALGFREVPCDEPEYEVFQEKWKRIEMELVPEYLICRKKISEENQHLRMQICAIFAGGPEDGIPCMPVPEHAYILCADSGLRLAEKLGYTPDFVLGDFDSLGAVPDALPHFTAPAEKDDTDTMLAVRYALEQGFRDIRIYGAFGGRLDHTLANLQTLEFIVRAGASGMLIGAGDWVCMQSSGTVRRYPKQPGRTFSLFAWSEQCSGICARGVYYPLEHAVLKREFPLGVSNIIIAEEAEIVCGEGVLLVVSSRDS